MYLRIRLILGVIFLASNLISQGQSHDNVHWRLVKVQIGQNLETVLDKKTDFKISIKKKQFKGSVGCNYFKGKLEYSEGSMTRPIMSVSSEMACPDYIDELGYAAIQALGVCDKLVLEGNQARFYNQTKLMLLLEKAQ